QPALAPRFAAQSAGVSEIDAESADKPRPRSPDALEPRVLELAAEPRTSPHEVMPERAASTPSAASGAREPVNAHGARRDAAPRAPAPLPSATVLSPAAAPPDPGRMRATEPDRPARDDAASVTRARRDDASPAPTPRQPLSALALAQRVQPTNSEPTVVH